jgi:hypothetical protein
MSTILKDTPGGFYCKPRGTVLIESTQMRWFSLLSGGRMDVVRGGQRHSRGGNNSRKPRDLVSYAYRYFYAREPYTLT